MGYLEFGKPLDAELVSTLAKLEVTDSANTLTMPHCTSRNTGSSSVVAMIPVVVIAGDNSRALNFILEGPSAMRAAPGDMNKVEHIRLRASTHVGLAVYD